MAQQRTKDVERITLELPTELASRVTEFRFAKRIDTKVAAIRRLIERGLEGEAQDDRSDADDRAADAQGD